MENVNQEIKSANLSAFIEHTLNEGGKAKKVEMETLSTLRNAVGGVLSSALNVVQKLIETRCSLCF